MQLDSILTEWSKNPIGANAFAEYYNKKYPSNEISKEIIKSVVRKTIPYVNFTTMKRPKFSESFYNADLRSGFLIHLDLLFLQKGFFAGGIVLTLVDWFTRITKFQLMRSATSAATARAFEQILQRLGLRFFRISWDCFFIF